MDPFSVDNIWKLGLALIGVVGISLATLKNAKYALVGVAVMLFVASLGLTEEAGDNFEFRTWLVPLQERRSMLAAGCACLMALAVLAHTNRVNLRQTPFLGWVYLFQGIYMGTVNILHGEISGGGLKGGLMAIAFATLLMAPFMLMMSVVLKEWEDYLLAIRTIAFGGLLWTVACTIQFLINHQILITGTGKRFVGLSGNPQHAAGLSAVVAMVAVWLFMNDPAKRLKLLWLFIAASHMVFVLWTGSRTGALCAVGGLAAIFYARIGRAVLFAPVAVGAIMGLVWLATEMGVQFGFERLTSMQDTRSAVWSILWETGMQNPIIGVGAMEAGASENGFLYGFASYGIVVPLLLFFQLGITAVVCLSLIRARSGAGPFQKRLADLCIGFFATYWMGNMVEGYGIARLSPQVPLFLAFACISAGMLVKMREEAAAHAEFGYPPEDQPHDLPPAADNPDYAWYGRSA